MRSIVSHKNKLDSTIAAARLYKYIQSEQNNFVSDQHGSQSWREKLEYFAGSTTMHGAPKIISSKSWIRRLVWLFCFVGSWAMFVVQTELVFRNYFTYPRNTKLEIVNDHPQFPDLTFCLRRGVSFYDAQEWLMRKKERLQNNETRENITLVNKKLSGGGSFDPLFHSVEFQRMTNNTSAMSKEEAFIEFYAFLSNKTLVQYSDFTIEEIPGGRDYLICFTISFAKFNIRIESIYGALMSGSGMDPDISNESEYP